MNYSSLANFDNSYHSSFVSRHKTTLVVAGALAAAGIITVSVHAQTDTQSTSSHTAVQATVRHTAVNTPSASQTAQTSAVPETTAEDSTAAGSNSGVQVQVNGQDIPVPQNGSTEQTVSASGGQTSVSVDSNGGASNNSGSSVNVSINSSTSTSGSQSSYSSQHTTIVQNGSTSVTNSY